MMRCCMIAAPSELQLPNKSTAETATYPTSLHPTLGLNRQSLALLQLSRFRCTKPVCWEATAEVL